MCSHHNKPWYCLKLGSSRTSVYIRLWFRKLHYTSANKTKLTFYGNLSAQPESIAHETIRTRADRDVVGDCAYSGEATSSRTWVSALGVDAGLVHWAVRTHETLWATAFIRVALELWQTLAHCIRVLNSASCVSSTRRWEARISRSCSSGGLRCNTKPISIQVTHSLGSTRVDWHSLKELFIPFNMIISL